MRPKPSVTDRLKALGRKSLETNYIHTSEDRLSTLEHKVNEITKKLDILVYQLEKIIV